MFSAALFYWIYSCVTSSTAYIRNTTPVKNVYTNVDAAIRSPPKCYMTIQCYHYETRVVVDRDSEGNTTTRTVTERRNTHYASEDFPIYSWMDRSPPSSTLHYLDVLHLVRLRTYKTVNYSPGAMTRLTWAKRSFIVRNDWDTHYDFHYHEDIPHQASNTLVYNDALGGAPWFTNCGLLVLMDLLFLGWIQRVCMLKSTGRVEYSLNKLVLN